MKRIDTINARENMFGVGKSGFHDNADLPGQDATYVSPEWFNTVQEELCNLLELRGIALNPASKRQLYDLLTTQADLEALATEIESNFIRKSQIIDNLTTNDATKPVSAAQAKNLQDNKLEKSALNNTLTSTSTTQALTAAQGKKLNDQAFGVDQRWVDVTSERVANTSYLNPSSKPIQVAIMSSSAGDFQVSTDGVNWVWAGYVGASGDSECVFPSVPAGHRYRLTSAFQKWSELK